MEKGATEAMTGTVEQRLQQALELHRGGQIGRAEALYLGILVDAPDHPTLLHLLGIVAYQGQRMAEAAERFRHALRVKPDFPEAQSNLGNALKQLGQIDDALAAYAAAIALRPGFADPLFNLGSVLIEQGRLDEAVTALAAAIAARPTYAEAHCALGLALKDLGRIDAAIAACRRAIACKPDLAEAHCNLGLAFKELGRHDDAITAYGQAVALRPGFAEAHANLGLAYHETKRFGEAAAAYGRAITLKPDFAEAHLNLGVALKSMGRIAEAIASYERAIALKPDYPAAVGQLVALRRLLCDWGQAEADEAWVLDIVRRQNGKMPPFNILSLGSTAQDQLLCARRWADQLAVRREARWTHRPCSTDGRIRVGYLSADFREHAVANLIAELIECHDRSRFEIIGYSYGPNDGSPMRRRLEAAFNRFVDLRPLSHSDAAARIHGDGVHILVDLTGYTMHARTEILAQRPAPIQVNYLGYPGTMGADFMDYILADPFIAPMDQQPYFAEKLVHLPACYQPNDRRRQVAEHTPSRGECGLPERGFVFCCFNKSYKITPDFFGAWMSLLQAVPDSVLWLLESERAADEALRRQAVRHGIDPQRLVFAAMAPLAEHLARHRAADLFLDTLPYNAHTTASDALWVGLPVVTCAGTTFAGRVAGSLLTAIGLPELITESLEDYAALALRLATDAPRLEAVRRKLDANRLTAPLFDTGSLARAIEAAFTSMRDRHAAGQPPQPFGVAPVPRIVQP
jgi:predicted O-linked N-acetylglucosamine transferase (SPINDLY family)